MLSAAEAPLYRITSKENEGLSLRNIGVRQSDQLVYVVVKSAWVGSGKEGRRPYSAEKPYKLQVSQEEAGANAELEPNDEPFKATPLPTAGYREGFLSPKSDVDYYVLRPGAPSLVKLNLSGVERLDTTLSVVKPGAEGTAEQTLLKANDGAVKEPEILNNVFCERECYVKVESALRKVDGKWVKDFENPEQPYRLTVQTSPDDGSEEREPNGRRRALAARARQAGARDDLPAQGRRLLQARPLLPAGADAGDRDGDRDPEGRPRPLPAPPRRGGQAAAGADERPGPRRGARGDPLLARARRLPARGARLAEESRGELPGLVPAHRRRRGRLSADSRLTTRARDHKVPSPFAVVAQLVEHELPKLGVEGSNPFRRS